MKVLLIGPTPFLTHSTSKLHVSIIDLLIKNKIELISLVHSHDKDFFYPENMNNEKPVFIYNHINSEGKTPVRLIPFENDGNTSIFFYEAIKAIKPDLIISIGDYRELSHLYASLHFLDKRPKWISVLSNSSCPVNENDYALFGLIDGILCTSEHSYNIVKPYFNSDNIKWEYVGSNPEFVKATNASNLARPFCSSGTNIIAIGKNSQYDCLPTVIDACTLGVQNGRNWNLYLHTDVSIKNTYDFEIQKSRANKKSGKEFIFFPEKSVSVKESPPASYLSDKFANSDISVSIPMVSASSMSVWDSMTCGCLPVVSRQGSHCEIVTKLANSLNINPDHLLVSCSKLAAAGDFELMIPDSKDLHDKIVNLYNEMKNQNFRKDIIEFSLNYQREVFMFKLTELMDKTIGIKPSIRIESY